MLRSKLKKKKWYDDDADWLPQKGRQFVMKKAKQKTEEQEATKPKIEQIKKDPDATKPKIEQISNMTRVKDRPGGFDPYYRQLPPTKQQPSKPPTLAKDRPGGFDPYYRQLPPTTQQPQSLADKALRGEPITDAEGLRRAKDAPDKIYIYGDTMYMAGTQGGILGKEWQENIKYIAKPILKQTIYNNIDKIKGLASWIAPEFAPEIALAGGALQFGKSQIGPAAEDEMKVKVYETTRYKQALQAYQANPQVKKVVGFSVGGMSALELKKKYENLTGSVYGTPYIDVFAKESIKEQMNKDREFINNKYGSSILNAPAKWIDNKFQDLAEKALGVDSVKTMQETGINRYRQAGDILTSLDNSAFTSIQADKIFNPVKAHTYTDQASQIITSDPTEAFGYINPDETISLIQ